MKDQIEKQAIEEIENDLRECHTEFPDENMNIYTDYSKTAEKMVAKGYRKQSEWIRVEDDTPKDPSKRVQVFLRDADFTKPIGENKIDTDRYVDGRWVRWGDYVTHWKDLPEPPKGEE